MVPTFLGKAFTYFGLTKQKHYLNEPAYCISHVSVLSEMIDQNLKIAHLYKMSKHYLIQLVLRSLFSNLSQPNEVATFNIFFKIISILY